MKQIAAFFDIDGTIYRNSLMIEHFKKLIKYELLDAESYQEHVEEAFKLWDTRVGDYDEYLNKLVEAYVKAMKGLPVSYNDFISDQVVYLKGNRVYSYTRDQIKWHKEQGHKVIFISGSPDFLVSRMAEKWGADDFRASVYKLNEQEKKYSGDIVPMWDSKHKIKALEEFQKEYNIDLSKSYAYGDTNGDFSMLMSVGFPRAINPSKELVLKIKETPYLRERAKIILERKDVIYELDFTAPILLDETR
ncbi:HAD family hydrolase [Fusobacterium necrophorum subsp. funduliforme]|nr:HAD-IB family hydrolase [Fusobacterium necrophorum]